MAKNQSIAVFARISTCSIAGAMFAQFFVACGDNVTNESITQIVQENAIVVSDISELPDCTVENEGKQAFVKGETASRICVDGSWQALFSATVDEQGELKCTSESLTDGSGVKILCNGDSIGVLLNGTNGADGIQGADGANGKSAYELAKARGFRGTEAEWLKSLKGTDGTNGKSAWEIAHDNGFIGFESDWLETLKGADGANGKSAYELAKEGGYTGTEAEWLESLKRQNCSINRFFGRSVSITCGDEKVLLLDSAYMILTDKRDKKQYKTVLVGEQVWMAENLNYDDSITYPSLVESSWCYDNLPENCEKYGRLYTWAVAMDSAGFFSINGKDCGYEEYCSPNYPVRGICPEGWHLPSTAEFETLISVAGGDSIAGRFLKSQIGWDGENGLDVLGFSALPAGSVSHVPIKFYGGERVASFWSASATNLIHAYYMFLSTENYEAKLSYNFPKDDGHSVRCVMD